MPAADIVIRGAREHNLQDVSVTLPRNQLIVMTGVSGSGKSSLAFDTLYAEGQRRYVESLSSYARQFLGQLPKPDVDAITGLAPSISIQQKAAGKNPRSTVGTITEIYDYLRVLFARAGHASCHQCGRPIAAQTSEHIVERIVNLPRGTRFQVLAPLVQRQKGEFRDLFADLLKQGYLRARVDGQTVALSDDLRLDKQMKHTVEVVIDRLVAGQSSRTRIAEAVEQALALAARKLLLVTEPSTVEASHDAEDAEHDHEHHATAPRETLYSCDYACTHCEISYEAPSPQVFSFNSPLGMCPECSGLGQRHEFVPALVVPDPSLSVGKGAVAPFGPLKKVMRYLRSLVEGAAAVIEERHGLKTGALLKTAWNKLPTSARQELLYGLGQLPVTYRYRHASASSRLTKTFPGLLGMLLEEHKSTRNPMRRMQLEKYMQVVPCSGCRGQRLNKAASSYRMTSLSFQAGGEGAGADGAAPEPTSLSLPEVCRLSIAEAYEFFGELSLTETERLIAEEVLKEVRGRLGFLLRCGLDYLTLERTAPTLSGGESQRIRLAGQIGCGLVGVVYILDEPSIGLHPRDNTLLLGSLQDLRDQGNTVIVVEHDEETMLAADHLIDFGPGPGVRGGHLVAQGSVEQIKAAERSQTGAFLSGRRKIEVPAQRRPISDRALVIRGAKHHNLRDVTATIPLGAFVCITGVSGSGKSSLINDILWQVLNREVNGGDGQPGEHTSVEGLDLIDKAIDIDQAPIGRTPRSNPATYVKLFDLIRDLYTQLPDSKRRGFAPGRFSFNVPGGRCEACEGHGANKLEMDFLAEIWITCPVCQGKRFNKETLEIRFKGKNIAEVLDMDVQQALEHFENIPKLKQQLQTLHDVGLDYLKLGQPSPTLSGGEAQRIKLAKELTKRSTGKTVYILDEPTTGLHFVDIAHLLRVLHGFADAGNTVIVVEHNLDVIKTADWVIDLGPEGGVGGGQIVCAGTPEEVALCDASFTGLALRPYLERDGRTLLVEPARPARGRGKKVTRKAESTPALPSAARRLAASPRWQTERRVLADGPEREQIVVRGAAQHNLQKIDLLIPRDQMSVFCGPSGSGKSSLAMDTLYAEGQRRYVESLSSYARQFLGQMPKPRVEHIHGLQPAIAIEQKTVGNTPRSTVGTVTEIFDYLRILFARLGVQHCPKCGIPVQSQTIDDVVDKLMQRPAQTRLLILAPQEVTVGQQYPRLWERLQEQGFSRVRVDGTTYRLEEVPEIDRRRKHNVEIVVDRITIDPNNRSRVAESVGQTFDLGQGLIRVATVNDEVAEPKWKVEPFSLFRSCQECGRSFEQLSPQNFSFNSPLGWCPSCEGIGTQQGTNLQALIADPMRPVGDGAIAAWPDPRTRPLFAVMLSALARAQGLPLDVPYSQLSTTQQRLILQGTGETSYVVRRSELPAAVMSVAEAGSPPAKSAKRKTSAAATKPVPASDDSVAFWFQYKGLFPAIEEASRVSFHYRSQFFDMTGDVPCGECGGSRLREEASHVRVQGKTLQQVCELPLVDTLQFLRGLELGRAERKIAEDLLTEATSRLAFLVDVGLHYLTLARTLPTLSGGETQRIRLAGQIGRALTGVLYVLDEPTIGLHPSDNGRLIQALTRLRDLGNTIVMVEHDREVLAAADRLYDFGPGAGRFGGTVTAEGSPAEVGRHPASLTGKFLSEREQIAVPRQRRIQSWRELVDPNDRPHPPGEGWLELTGARMHNLRNVDVAIPLGTLTAVTGVSGSGKSSLIQDTLARAVARRLHRASDQPGPFDELRGLDKVSKLIVVDQQPLGSTPSSNPATYTGVFDHIRELFSRLPEARQRGYKAVRFSFNRPGGRCEDCEGNGQKLIEMHFLPDVWVECDTCCGQRYNAETLGVKFRGHSISDVLNMPIGTALEVFADIPKIHAPLAVLAAIGLDYLTLGQSAATLSGGEAQRVKLAAELSRPQTGRTLYLLDEPTTGLHFDDIRKLLVILNSLVDKGNTVVVIEHNLDVIKTADWLIDLGPHAGSEGGWIVAAGTPEDVVAYAERAQAAPGPGLMRSLTGEALAEVLATSARGERMTLDEKLLRRRAGKRASASDESQVPPDDDTEGAQVLTPAKSRAKKVRAAGAAATTDDDPEGREWHRSRQGFLKGRVVWSVDVLDAAIVLLKELLPEARVHWRSKMLVRYDLGEAGTIARLVTKRPAAVDLELLVPPERIRADQILGLGERSELERVSSGHDRIRLSFTRQAQVSSPELRRFLELCRTVWSGLEKT